MQRLAAFALLLFAACTADEGTTWHRDVKPLVDARCVNCHSAGGIAPFELTSYASAKAWAAPIKRSVTNRTMPPWSAVAGCAEYEHDESLTDAQISMISSWADAGAPEGDPADAPATAEKTGGLSRVDLSLAMPATYAPRQSPDDYRCFLIDWPETTDTFVTGFRAKPGNATIVHHVIAYLIDPDKVEAYEKLDADEEGEGYTCFGGPGGNQGSLNWLGAWAPGSDGSDFPAGTGLKVRPGSKIALQLHYNSSNAASGATDLTSIEVRLDPTVERQAFVIPFTDPSWVGFLGPSTMTIPAGEKVSHSYKAKPSLFFTRVSNGAIAEDASVVIHTASLHMHTLGVGGELRILRKDQGADECMLDVDRWDFDWQRQYRFKDPKRFDPGDELFIECTFDNTGALHSSGAEVRDVAWGEGTGDEMCLGVLYVSKL